MARLTGVVVPGEVSQEQWDAKFDATAKKVKDMGGVQTTDDLTEGAVSKYDTGVPPTDTDALPEGTVNKYDTGVPPADTDALPEGAANKYDTGVPPTDTDALPEGTDNKYDTGVPPATQDDLPDGTTAKQYPTSDKTKLAGVEENAKDDQTGPEIQTAVKGLDDADRDIMVSEPLSGENKVYGAHRNADGNLEYEYDDTPEA